MTKIKIWIKIKTEIGIKTEIEGNAAECSRALGDGRRGRLCWSPR